MWQAKETADSLTADGARSPPGCAPFLNGEVRLRIIVEVIARVPNLALSGERTALGGRDGLVLRSGAVGGEEQIPAPIADQLAQVPGVFDRETAIRFYGLRKIAAREAVDLPEDW